MSGFVYVINSFNLHILAFQLQIAIESKTKTVLYQNILENYTIHFGVFISKNKNFTNALQYSY